MNRLFWGIALLVIVTGGAWAQSTWRGQAEVWTASDAPADGLVAASNEFPKGSLLTVENYKSRKTIQVRVVALLPSGSAALVLLNRKAAAALDIKAGEIPLVGVRMDPTGVDRADNPDPDVNPMATRPVTPDIASAGTSPAVVTPPAPLVVTAPTPSPTVAPEPKDTKARTPASSADLVRGATTLDPDLLPLPALASPEPVTEPAAEPSRTPLPVVNEPAEEAPVTPGRKVFVTTRDPEPVASETVPETAPEVEPPVPGASAPDPVVEAPASEAPEEAPPAVVEAPAPAPEATPAPVVAAPVVEPAPTPAPVAAAPAPVVPAAPVAGPALTAGVQRPALSAAWVSVPGKLEGPVLGAVPVLGGLEKGRSYVQVGAWAREADVLSALGSLQSYVPLALYKAEGEKNPWRIVVASAPKGQLGFLLMHYRSQGFRLASMVKG